MKKWLSLLSIFVAILSVSALGACIDTVNITVPGGSPSTATTATPGTTPVSAATPGPIPSPAPVKGIIDERRKAAETELVNVFTAVLAAMADAVAANITAGAVPPDVTTANFGNTGRAISKPYTGTDLTVSGVTTVTVGQHINGGAKSVSGSYSIDQTGKVTQLWYP